MKNLFKNLFCIYFNCAPKSERFVHFEGEPERTESRPKLVESEKAKSGVEQARNDALTAFHSLPEECRKAHTGEILKLDVLETDKAKGFHLAGLRNLVDGRDMMGKGKSEEAKKAFEEAKKLFTQLQVEIGLHLENKKAAERTRQYAKETWESLPPGRRVEIENKYGVEDKEIFKDWTNEIAKEAHEKGNAAWSKGSENFGKGNYVEAEKNFKLALEQYRIVLEQAKEDVKVMQEIKGANRAKKAFRAVFEKLPPGWVPQRSAKNTPGYIGVSIEGWNPDGFPAVMARTMFNALDRAVATGDNHTKVIEEYEVATWACKQLLYTAEAKTKAEKAKTNAHNTFLQLKGKLTWNKREEIDTWTNAQAKAIAKRGNVFWDLADDPALSSSASGYQRAEEMFDAAQKEYQKLVDLQ